MSPLALAALLGTLNVALFMLSGGWRGNLATSFVASAPLLLVLLWLASVVAARWVLRGVDPMRIDKDVGTRLVCRGAAAGAGVGLLVALALALPGLADVWGIPLLGAALGAAYGASCALVDIGALALARTFAQARA